MKDKTGK